MEWRRQRETSAGIAIPQTEMWTQDLLNTIQGNGRTCTHARIFTYINSVLMCLSQDWAVGRKKVRTKRNIFRVWGLVVFPHVMLQLDILLARLTVSVWLLLAWGSPLQSCAGLATLGLRSVICGILSPFELRRLRPRFQVLTAVFAVDWSPVGRGALWIGSAFVISVKLSVSRDYLTLRRWKYDLSNVGSYLPVDRA